MGEKRNVADLYGAIHNGQGKGILKRALPLGTVVLRKSGNVGGGMVRMIKVKMDGPPALRWISYARWWWEKNKGPVPPGKLVIHVDGDELNDEPSNLELGTPGTKLVLAHARDPKWSKEQHKRAAAGCAEFNRKNGRINRAENFLRTYWYPVVDEVSVILNVPFRKRKRVLACFGVDVSKYPANGLGRKPASEVQRAIKASRVRPARGVELPMLRKYDSYCLLDPVSKKCIGPMSGTVGQLVAQLDRMGLWSFAEKYAKKDPRERK